MKTRDETGVFSNTPLAWKREGDCIVCTSHNPGSNGYFDISVGRRRTRLHRLIAERKHGELKGVVVRHTCDNNLCINPHHLAPGTPAENSADMKRRGRSTFGARNPMAKLSDAQILEIRASKLSNRETGELFGISTTTVSLIKNRKRWAHVC